MTNQHRQRTARPPWKSVFRGWQRHPRAAQGSGQWRDGVRSPLRPGFLARHGRFLRRAAVSALALCGLAVLGCFGLWWRLASGPIQLDIATPWLASAIEQNFGSGHHVQVGGTQIERTENGGTAVRIRDIVVRDTDGTVVASAPKAEVRVSGAGLLTGHMRAESLDLVGAEMAVRIERDGGVTVFAGADKHPIATASVSPFSPALSVGTRTAGMIAPPAAAAPATIPAADTPPGAQRRPGDILAALLSWIDGIGETGLDGHELGELGLKSGNLTVNDERTGKRWAVQDISLSVKRRGGGVEVDVGSGDPKRPWSITASITPSRTGLRKIELEARRILVSDLLLATRLGDGEVQADIPVSASIAGEIRPDGLPQSLSGRIIAEAGSISGADDTDGRLAFDHAEFRINWDGAARTLTVPSQIISGGNRMTLIGRVDVPEESSGAWPFKIGGGTVVLSGGSQRDALVLNRITVAGRYDPAKRRIVLDEGDVGNEKLGVAVSGNLDFSGSEMRLTGGLAGTRMPVGALKRLWPVFVSPKVRDWFNEHLTGGTLERIVVAVNAPLNTLKASGPPIPDDGLSLDALATGCLIRPADGLPALHDADLNVHIVGRDAVVSVGKAAADLPSGRKLVMSSGVFEVPDTQPHEPPAKVRFKLDGPVPAAAELLRMDRLRDVSDTPFEPSATRGTISAQVSLTMPLKAFLPPGSTNYAITVDATNFSADRMIMGQKLEAALLRATASPQGFQLKGDVKIGGTPVSLEYRKARGESDAEVRISGLLDQAARTNLGLDAGGAISGAVPVRVSGRVTATSEREGRFAVEADLTSAQIEGLLPGWVKPSGKPARATFTVTTKPQAIRLEDLLIEGAGGGVKGTTIEFDGSGQLQSASFPAYGFSDGDRANLKVERAADGALRVIMRGDVYDGRGFVKEAAGSAAAKPSAKRPQVDVDLDIRLGAVVGFDGEALRGLELKMSRRAGEVRSFDLTAKIGRDATLTGDLRARSGGRQLVHLDTTDAGAFFRFADVYARMTAGVMSIAMDPPSAANDAQRGVLNVRDFAVHDEAELARAVVDAPQGRRDALQFSSMQVEFSRFPGRVVLRDGVVRGPLLGGTIDGAVDYTRDELHLRGTLIPLYGPNNFLGQLPVLGLFMGGRDEGLVGITYEVVGRPGHPVVNVNPLSPLALGVLRKGFEFPAANDGSLDR